MKHPNVIRGRMSAEEKQRIEDLAARMRKPNPRLIAARINRHPATVNWYMLTHGLIDRKPGRAPKPYSRGGKMIYPYSECEDARIEQLRQQGRVYREIGEILTREFGVERDAHSVQVRAMQLAAAPLEEV